MPVKITVEGHTTIICCRNRDGVSEEEPEPKPERVPPLQMQALQQSGADRGTGPGSLAGVT